MSLADRLLRRSDLRPAGWGGQGAQQGRECEQSKPTQDDHDGISGAPRPERARKSKPQEVNRAKG
jgi:hypothetical protein